MSKEVHRIYFCKDGAILDTQIREGEDVTDTLKRCFNKIADLEAKLDEKEERINWLVEAEFNRKWAKKYVEMRRKEEPMLCLPDSDEVYEKYFELKQQLAEKDKEIKKLNFEAQKYFEDAYCNDSQYQDKISFAVEQLTQFEQEVLNYVDKVYGGIEDILDKEDLDYILNNQINKIKGDEDE